ncbi:MAG: hypothetical protein JWM53_5769 [bacterium]|nr:hypothetical protein [bacterium]
MRARAAALGLLVASSVGCGAHTSLRDGVYHTAHAAFRLGSLGPGWQRQSSDADVAFYEPQLDAMIMANSECPAEHDAPLKVATNSLLIGFTDREIVDEELVPLAGREALHRRLRAKLDGVALTLDLFVLKKDGCIYDLVYLSPPETVARGAADFARFVAGFDTVDQERLARRSAETP